MDLVLVISTSVAAIAAFLIGFIFGKMKQASKDKTDVFSAVYDLENIICELCKNEEREDWVKGAMYINKMYFDVIFKVFYGEKPNK